MNLFQSPQEAVANTYNEVNQSVVDFMTDCGLADTDVNAGNLNLALEYAYRPLPRFWRDFNLAALVETISVRFPDWRSTVLKNDRSTEEVLCEVEEFLHCRAFDEANAEIIMALPQEARPTDSQAASELIRVELRKRKHKAALEFAQQDGSRCGEGALQELHCLERAANGVEFKRLGAEVARLWRSRRLAQRQQDRREDRRDA